MKKAIKMFLFIAAMFITVSVKAMPEKLTLIEDKNQRFFSGLTEFHFKMVKGNSNAYAFCLDSNLPFASGSSYALASNGISGISKNKIRNVVFKAYISGLGTSHNVYGLSNHDFYGVTQMAVWNAAHGSDKGGMRSSTYFNWLAANSKRQKAYNDLVSAGNPSIPKYEFSMNTTDSTLKPDANKEFFVSTDFKINGSKDLAYTVKAENGSCILYGDSCKGTQTVKAGEVFKLRADYVEGKTVNAKATITSSEYLVSYEFDLFTPNSSGVQNLSVFIPKFDSWTTTIGSKGFTKKQTVLKVSKTDIAGGELEGAKLVIKDSKGNVKDSWTSTKEVHMVEGLNADEIYNITEDAAPVGYQPIHNSIYFKLDSDGKVTVCDLTDDSKDKTVCNPMSTADILKITNEPTKLNVSKTDIAGKEIAGAKLVIKDNNGKEVTSWVSVEGKTHVVEGLAIGKIYNLTEDAAPVGYQPIHNSIYFQLENDGKVTVCNLTDSSKDKSKCDPMSKEDILKITNEPTKLLVSKTDATGQKEIGGANLVIKDSTGKEITSWVSVEGKTHLVEGLTIGEIYEMIETLAPEGYAPLKTSIFFVINPNGKVTTCNIVKDSKGNNVCDPMSEEEKLTIKNYTTGVVITKKDLATGENIKGAHLQILDENGNVVMEWVSDGTPYTITGLALGKYTLVETLPAKDYQVEMIINDKVVTKYDFEIKDGETVIIDVYNKIMEVPRTGVSAAGTYMLGGLVMLIGVGTITIAKKKENM